MRLHEQIIGGLAFLVIPVLALVLVPGTEAKAGAFGGALVIEWVLWHMHEQSVAEAEWRAYREGHEDGRAGVTRHPLITGVVRERTLDD